MNRIEMVTMGWMGRCKAYQRNPTAGETYFSEERN
jgi:hypothetical protein